jgi:alkaline phosphatase D
MSALRPPGLGPIIGHTTDTTCRLWIQAGKIGDEDIMSDLSANRRTVGVIGVMSGKDAQTAVVKDAFYFRLHREFDRTGTFVLGEHVALGRHEDDVGLDGAPDKPVPLTPDSEYTVRMATLSLDDPLEDADRLTDVELKDRLPDLNKIKDQLRQLRQKECQLTFRTFPKETGGTEDKLAFLLGSCRYPGLMWKIKEADRIFGPMVEHFEDAPGRKSARFNLMVGDQIYADMFNKFPLGLADTYEEFQDRYQKAFGSINMRQLLKTAPTYMILDDHEIEDNWTQDQLHRDGKYQIFNLAIGAYMSYQWSHGPHNFDRHLYYEFVCGGYPFFVLDTRTQRFKDKNEEGLRDNHLLGRPTIDPAHRGQLDELLVWLSECQSRGNQPKFIVSSSVFAPNEMKERMGVPYSPDPELIFDANRKRRDDSDSWPAYPKTRKAIIDHIVREKIQNVVFLTGDIHCSNIARLFFKTGGGDSGLFAYDVTSSAFYWPYIIADGDPNDYVHDSTAPDQLDPFPFQNGVMDYEAWAFTQEDNFARIEIDKANSRLVVRYYDRDGKLLEVRGLKNERLLENALDLKPW